MKAILRSSHTLVRVGLVSGVLVALLLPAVPLVQAQDDRDSTGFAVISGRVVFGRYCASCHGRSGIGNGNVAQYLKVPPADLTQLTNKYGGEFPAARVHAFIDGTDFVRGHGTSEMPVWGDLFRNPLSEPTLGDEGDAQRAARIVDQLVSYLETIQVDGPAKPSR